MRFTKINYECLVNETPYLPCYCTHTSISTLELSLRPMQTQPSALADPRNIDWRLMSWSAAEVVLMDYQNTTVIDCIYDALDMYTLVSLSVTNFKGHRSWVVYKKRTFNIIKNLAKYFVDPSGFREIQRKTGAVIFGEVALLYFRRSNIFHGRVDVATKPIHIISVIRHLVRTEHYRLWNGSIWINDIAKAESEIQRLLSPMSSRTGRRASLRLQEARARLQRPQYAPATKSPNGKRFFFERDAAYGQTTQLCLWVAQEGEMQVILDTSSS